MPATTAKSSAVVVPHAPKWYQRIAAWMIYALIQMVTATLRYRWVDQGRFFRGRTAGAGDLLRLAQPAGALDALLLQLHQKAQSQRRAGGDGEREQGRRHFYRACFECFRVQPVRGSTSRRGHQALRELTTWARRDYDLAITPDGPRGPCYVVQEGVIALAQLTGRPIVPVSFNLKWKIQTKSWDRFQIPLPFSRCEMIFGQPIRVPRGADEAEREKLRLELENGLKGITRD